MLNCHTKKSSLIIIIGMLKTDANNVVVNSVYFEMILVSTSTHKCHC